MIASNCFKRVISVLVENGQDLWGFIGIVSCHTVVRGAFLPEGDENGLIPRRLRTLSQRVLRLVPAGIRL